MVGWPQRAMFFRFDAQYRRMSELPGRVRRAFVDHTAFEQVDDATFESTATTFDGTVEATDVGGQIRFDTEVRVPLLNSVTEDEVAAVVEDGWFESDRPGNEEEWKGPEQCHEKPPGGCDHESMIASRIRCVLEPSVHEETETERDYRGYQQGWNRIEFPPGEGYDEREDDETTQGL